MIPTILLLFLTAPSQRPPLSGADMKDIPCWGRIRRRLNFGLRTFSVTFLLATVYRPILGLDFLSAYGLLVDQVGRQVGTGLEVSEIALQTASRHSRETTIYDDCLCN